MSVIISYMRKFILLFQCGIKVIYVGDMTHLETLDQSESMYLI